MSIKYDIDNISRFIYKINTKYTVNMQPENSG